MGSIARSIAAQIPRVLIPIPRSIKICPNQIPEHRIKEHKLHQKSTNKKHKSAKQTDE
jgi:hypothetical protein